MKFLEQKLNEEISNIFKPRDETTILADLLETNERNIPIILKMHKKWSEILSKNTMTNDEDKKKIIKLYNDLEKYKYPDEKSAGILGLKRMYKIWNEELTSNLVVLSNCIDWVHWVGDMLDLFKHRVGQAYMEQKNI